jgi:hypothetical protein
VFARPLSGEPYIIALPAARHLTTGISTIEDLFPGHVPLRITSAISTAHPGIGIPSFKLAMDRSIIFKTRGEIGQMASLREPSERQLVLL